MRKIDSIKDKKPTNSELGSFIGKSEASIRILKNTNIDDYNDLLKKYKLSTMGFVSIDLVTNNSIEKSEIEEKIKTGELPGIIDSNNNYYIYPEYDKVSTLKEILKNTKQTKLCFGNFKGGVGKTTDTLNIAASFSALGFKVLVIDADPQGNASSAIGIYNGIYKYTIIDLIKRYTDENIEELINQSIIETKTSFGFDIIPNNADSAIDTENLHNLSRTHGTVENLLSKIINKIEKDYDFILIDLPPRIDILLRMSIMASDEFILCFTPHPFAKLGMSKLLKPIYDYSNIYYEEKNKKYNILGGIINDYTKGINLQDAIADEMTKNLEEFSENTTKMFDTKIPRNKIIPESQQGQGAVINVSPTDKIARLFLDLSVEILEKLVISKMSKGEI